MSDPVTADLIEWAQRARADLDEYAGAARESGEPIELTESLVRELDDILAGRPTWQRAFATGAATHKRDLRVARGPSRERPDIDRVLMLDEEPE